ncbi:MAG: hypothetical protein ABJJ05_07295 [Maribacter litoralis]|uniref:hypothetical protein n=1 Tax=Maribacter litoralis TaxID=2059726 RepID=UPI003299C507
MEFNKNYLSTYYKHIQTDDNFPEAFLYELFLVGKMTRDKETINEIAEYIEKYGTVEINAAFKTRSKLPEKGDESEKILNSFINFTLKDPLFPLGKLYGKLGFLQVFVNETLAEKLEEQPEVIQRFEGIEKLIIEIDLQDNILEQFCNIKTIKSLEIEGSYQKLPETIGGLENLEELELDLEHLQQLPISFFNLKSLKEFSLTLSIKEGEQPFALPNRFHKLTKLVELNFYDAALEDISELLFPENIKEIGFYRLKNIKKIPKSIVSLNRLEKLSIFDCADVAELPSAELMLHNLWLLRLQKLPQIHCIEDKYLFLPNIRSVRLDENVQISNGNTVFENTELSISNISLLEYVLNHPENFPKLKKLKVTELYDFSSITVGLEQLKSLESIEVFQLKNSEILWRHLGKCSQLSHIKIVNADVETLPEDLRNIESLAVLEISDCSNLVLYTNSLPARINDFKIVGIKELVSGNRLIRTERTYLDSVPIQDLKNFFCHFVVSKLLWSITGGEQFSEEDLTQYLPEPEKLKELKSYGTTAHFQDVLKYCTKLERLCLANNNQSNLPINSFPAKQLKELKLKLYNAGNLEVILGNTPNLKTIFLEHYRVANSFPEVRLNQLENLHVSRSSLATFEPLEAPALKNFSLSLCYDFNMEGYEKLAKFTRLKKIHFNGIHDDVDNVPENITSLDLTELNFGYHMKAVPEYLKKLQNLETLYVDNIDFDHLPTWIADLPKLTRLSIDGCSFKYSVPEYFQKLKLKELKYYISKFKGSNMSPEKYKYLITPGYTILKKEFSNHVNTYF